MAKHIFLFLFLFVILKPMNSFGGWLVYYKQAFEGHVVNVETAEPLEGVVVVAIYKKWSFCLIDGPRISEIKVKEVLTGKDGGFYIPAYTTVIQPLSWVGDVTFTIYKPGYLGLEEEKLENFLGGKDRLLSEVKFKWILDREVMWSLKPSNIIGLPKIKSDKNRLDAIPGRSELVEEKATNLMKYIDEERANFFKKKR